MSRICTICARGGSKGVANKNLKPLLGVPLIVHTIRQATSSGLFDAIAVSSDSPEILRVSAENGVTHLVERPADLADDFAPKEAAIKHCVREVSAALDVTFDTIVDLDVTSPLRDVGDIVGAVALLEETDASNVITGAPARRSPYFNLVELDEHDVVHLSKPPAKPILRRQDAPRCFDMNASVYVWTPGSLFEGGSLFQERTRLFVMPEERSIDIDSPLDFEFVEFLMSKKGGSVLG